LETVIRWNERYRGWANLADNIALAFFVASGVESYSVTGVDTSVLLGVSLGLVFATIAWHFRGLLQSEQ
jgi:hypothetical protein